MISLTIPAVNKPQAKLPGGGLSGSLLWVYEGVPDDQEWIATSRQHAQMCGAAADLECFDMFSTEPLGHPLGADLSRSLRVARCTGLVVDEKDGVETLKGVSMAHGCCFAHWEDSADGNFLVVEFQSPNFLGWGAGKDTLAKEQVLVRCMHQYRAMAKSLVSWAEGGGSADGVFVQFQGDWPEGTQFIQHNLSKICVSAWLEEKLSLAGAPNTALAA